MNPFNGILLTIGLLFVIGTSPVAGQQVAPVLTGNEQVSRVHVPDGKVVLGYDRPEGRTILLQEARDPSFADARQRYQGTDPATVVTGLAEGDYYYRIAYADTKGEPVWSDVLHVEVTFMARGPLFTLLGTGLVVVLLTAGAILIGQRRSGGAVPA